MSGQPPLVSVVIPCYNVERYLAAAIDSVLGQSYENVEVIVVDDGSTDGSPGILDGYGDRIRVLRQSNLGLPAARNAGIRVCRGAYMAFLDADDWWDCEFVAKMVTALKHSGAVLAYCGWQNVGLPGRRGEPFVPPDYSGLDAVEAFLEGCRWPVHAALTQSALVRSVGAFDETLTSGEDFDLWLRIAPFGGVVRVPEVLAHYRFHDGPQMTKNHLKIIANHWRIQQKFLREHPEAVRHLSRQRLRELTHGELLRNGFDCYWRRDLDTARSVFRMVMRAGYGSISDWAYMLPALLPISLHRKLLNLRDRSEAP